MQQAPGAPLGILPPCCFRSQACSSAWAPETPGGLVWAKMRQQGSDPRIHEPRAPDHEGISTASEILSAHIQPNGSAASNARRLGRKHHVSRTVSFRPLQSRMGRRRAAGQEGKRGEGGAEGNREGRCLPGWWSLYLPAMRADRGPGHSRDSIELQLGRHLGIEVASDDGAETAHRARGRAPGHYFFFFPAGLSSMVERWPASKGNAASFRCNTETVVRGTSERNGTRIGQSWRRCR